MSTLRKRVEQLEREGSASDILGATVAVDGTVRMVLYASGGCFNAPPDMTEADLPPGCFIHRYDPADECATLYKSTIDGRAHVQQVVGVDEDIFLGRKKWEGDQ
jgi:hypothetical protein